MFVPSLKVKITNLLRLSIEEWYHHGNVIMSAMASQITSVPIVYLTVCSGTDQRKHQSSASLAFVRGIHWWPVNSPHKGPVTRKIFPFDGVIVKIQIHIFISSKQFSKERANSIFSLWCGLSVSTHSKATPQGRLHILLTHWPHNVAVFLNVSSPNTYYGPRSWTLVRLLSGECRRLPLMIGNGLVLAGNKPLPEPRLTQIYVAIWRH